jgi:hypothetical protein
MVLLILALMQLIGGYLLGRSADRRPAPGDTGARTDEHDDATPSP